MTDVRAKVRVFLPLVPPHSVPHLPRLRRMMERRRTEEDELLLGLTKYSYM